MSDKLHLIIPGAVLQHEAGAALPPLTPNLRALLAAMTPDQRLECGEDSASAPYELALAQANGLPGGPGYIPWAAFETGTIGLPCAFIQLCHWQVGADHIMLSPPDQLAVDEATSQALLAAMAPYFLEDGITLQPYGQLPGTWLATGEVFRGLRSMSLDRLRGRRLTPAVLDAVGAPAATLRRLQNEMQMLLYTHPANDRRQQQGLGPVNSFWITGAGVLDHAVPVASHVRVESRLLALALRHDAAALAQAWQEVDADACASLLALLRAGGEARLTLCGEHAAQSFVPAKTSFWRRVKHVLGLQPIWDGRSQL
ncbi:phosphoglycerate mutase [Polaromonas sp. SM01]|uniref:phosphoglycerate mutase n=1 Tax=Polaromonas sp. SM01 TaxID=3085630 RepID=UPI002981125E|nr:phosphoglycerate mutase [Polaromonas sp. SM01]MDW5442282.1 phosphoglycerate mutase [Polaromonas sp. SM01]